jgi:DNA-binding transcriptional LysR family regulator
MDQTETGRPDAAELAAMLRSLRAPDRLNLRQVEAFMAIAAAGSITAAAALLNVSQPGLSRLLMQLERRLGFPLFLRQGKRLTITPEGLDFREEVARSLAGMGHLA